MINDWYFQRASANLIQMHLKIQDISFFFFFFFLSVYFKKTLRGELKQSLVFLEGKKKNEKKKDEINIYIF